MNDRFAGIPVYKRFSPTPVSEASSLASVVIVGAGPVGLTLALDLGQRGHHVKLLNRLDFIPGGSKAICFSKRSLDIWNRLGVGRRMVDKGVVWNLGKVFRGDGREPIFEFDLLPLKDQEMPAFINLQQYYAEEFLIDAVAEYPNIQLCWGHEVTDLKGQQLTVLADDEEYSLSADWIIAADGSRSTVRDLLGLDFSGRVFEDNFLIADVRFKDERPTERWFWFDPPWGGASCLVHKQPDGVWRIDFQLGWDIDRTAEMQDDKVAERVRRALGDDVDFEKEWYSIYTFQCRRMDRFVHDRVLFVGDSAHLVSPFGARGCNGGLADVDNLGWKLDAVLNGADPALIETYNTEAVITADENILNSTRSTDFMTPKSDLSQAFRDAVLDLAQDQPFARPFVNSGRLSTPVSYPDGPLNTPDTDVWDGGVPPGSPAVDAPVEDGWLLPKLGGEWRLLSDRALPDAPLPAVTADSELAQERYEIAGGGVYLIRPDQYVAARWKTYSEDQLRASAWPG
ncbi:MAG: FAD-dependent monooxygenase [Pseudomonadota bacterium]